MQTISRFLALSSKEEETGVAIIPALKVSRKANNTWNKRPLDDERLKVMSLLDLPPTTTTNCPLQAASEVQRSMRIISKPATVDPEDIKAFLESGYKGVDETQVVRIETNKYFDFLMSLITASGILSE